MKLTNFFNLPQPIYDAIANDKYNKGDCDYSMTGLLNPPRITQLTKKHWDEISEDVSDRIFSLMGQIIHGIFERAERTAMAEKRLFMVVGGKRISGQLDRFHIEGRHIQDYKVTSIWKVQDGVPEDFEAQVNSYVELARANDFEVDTAEIIAILRDWKKRASRTIDGYPTHQVKRLSVNIWSRERTQNFLLDRIAQHERAKTEEAFCTEKDRWNKGDRFAVHKGASRKATRLYDTLEEAEKHVAAFGDGYRIEMRRGENIRCEDFCLVADHCSQFQTMRQRRS